MTDLPPPQLPAPMTPPDCDLRGMPYMPLDITRLFDSNFYILSTGDEFKAALSLWAKSFLQVPAGSLPDDERILAHLSGAGPAWPGLRAMALHGWIRCTDGRLYHRTVSEKAREAWQVRRAHRARTAAATAARIAMASRGEADDARDEDATPDVTLGTPAPASPTKGREGKRREGMKEESPSLPPDDRSGDLLGARPDPRGTRLPEAWQPGPAERAFAANLDLDVPAIAAEFRRYWCARAGSGARKVNWSMTWQSWCTRAAREAKERPRWPGGGRHGAPRPGPTAWLHEEHPDGPIIDGEAA